MCHSEKGVEDEEDLYDCVYDDEDGGEIYEDLMKTEAIPTPVSPILFNITFIFTSYYSKQRGWYFVIYEPD